VTEATASRYQRIYVANKNCRGHTFRPEKITLACGDNNLYATEVHFFTETPQAYGAREAGASATIHQNNCKPDCASGQFFVDKGALILKRVVRCREGLLYYSRAEYAFPEGQSVVDIEPSEHCSVVHTARKASRPQGRTTVGAVAQSEAPVSLSARAVRSRAQPAASSYKFEDLAVTRLVSDGKPTSGFTSYYRLNRALPFAPRAKLEGEEEGGPRLFAAYLSVDGVHEEGSTEAMGDEGYDAGRHCYAETLEVHAHEHQPRVGEVVNVSLVVKGRRLLTVRTRVSNRKLGPTIRERDGSLLTREALPYEKAFGCLKKRRR